jgi:hypothetical protein
MKIVDPPAAVLTDEIISHDPQRAPLAIDQFHREHGCVGVSPLESDLKTLQLERIGVGGEIEINGANLSLRRLLAVRFRPQRK